MNIDVKLRIFAACVFFVMLAASPGIASAADEDDPPADRRTQGRNTDSGGQGQAGVQGPGILATAGRSGSGSGAQGGGGSGCKWTVVWRAQGSDNFPGSPDLADGFEGSSGSPTLIGGGGSTPGALGPFQRLSVDAKGLSLIAGGSDSSRLRFVVPYGNSACDALPGAFITIAEVEALAVIAFDELKSRWPTQDITLGWPEPTEDTWTALATDMAWSPISASASAGGVTVTVTATPEMSAWEIGEVNTRIGGEGSVSCDGPGDLPRVQDDATCRVWFAGPSTGLADRNGVGDAITLGLTVEWNVGYTSNLPGFANPNWLVWPTESFLDGVVVNTTQSVPSAEVASG